MTGSITFQTDPDVTFVAGLARWIDPPPAPAAPAEEGAEAPAPAPTAFEKECVALEEGLEFQKLYATLREPVPLCGNMRPTSVSYARMPAWRPWPKKQQGLLRLPTLLLHHRP